MEVQEGTVRGGRGYAEESESGVEEEPSKKCSRDAPSPPVHGCFDCNICLDSAAEPVVTLCGHLYCWPCIYRWLLLQSASRRRCPVCKAPLSEDTLVPLYGRGGLIGADGGSQQSLKIPRRPSVYRDHALIASVIEHRSPRGRQQQQEEEEEEHFDVHPPRLPHQRYHHPYYGVMSEPSPLLAAPVFHSTAGGVLGELAVAVFPWVFGIGPEAGVHRGSRPYDLTASIMNSPRLRRRQMMVESSLHQLWLFLSFCAALCLFLL